MYGKLNLQFTDLELFVRLTSLPASATSISIHDVKWQNATYTTLANFGLVSVLENLEIAYECTDLKIQLVKVSLSMKCG